MWKKVLEVGAAIIIASQSSLAVSIANNNPSTCNDVDVIWVNGSGAVINGTDNNYTDFRDAVDAELSSTGLRYDFYELGTSEHGGYKYPAVAMGFDNLENFWVTLMAKVGGGEIAEFGESVNQGVGELKAYTEEIAAKCPNTKFVVGGLSQGGMVVSKSLSSLNENKFIYAATFGDPKLFLPEGAGIYPYACRNQNLSEYRMYVPDCYAYEGLLGGANPYQPSGWSGKLGAWCNFHDAVCSSYIELTDIYNGSLAPHGSYGNSMNADQLYPQAAKIIAQKVREEFGLPAGYGTKNVAIMLDSTGSMGELIADYKSEALRLAESVILGGGKIALVEYREISQGFTPVLHCGFSSSSVPCTMSILTTVLDGIVANDGGELPESVLNAAMFTLDNLDWENGASKGVVVLTDAEYHDPEEYEGRMITTQDVIERSYEIDPVIFYTITPEEIMGAYNALTVGTEGRSFSAVNELEFSTDYIIEDDMPTYEPINVGSVARSASTIWNEKTEKTDDGLKVNFETDGDATVLAVDDYILGIMDKTEITITDLEYSKDHTIRLVPIGADGYAGEAKEFVVSASEITKKSDSVEKEKSAETGPINAPNCGYYRKEDW